MSIKKYESAPPTYSVFHDGDALGVDIGARKLRYESFVSLSIAIRNETGQKVFRLRFSDGAEEGMFFDVNFNESARYGSN